MLYIAQKTASLAERSCESFIRVIDCLAPRKAPTPRNLTSLYDFSPASTITMADEDEDLSHLRAPDAADEDPTEEAQDFSVFDKLMFAFTHPTFRKLIEAD
jgi:hypothetical protein